MTNILDRWSTYGHLDKTGKLIVIMFAIEPMPVLHGFLISHHTSTGCLRRGKFQLRCSDPGCFECYGVFIDLSNVWSLYIAPVIARVIIGLLPKKVDKDHVNFGNICPSDIDWDKLNAQNRELHFRWLKIKGISFEDNRI